MDSILLTINHNGTPQEIEVKFLPFAYTYRFQIQLNEQEVYFEPDEERNLRAVVPPGTELNRQQIELLALIGQELQFTLEG